MTWGYDWEIHHEEEGIHQLADGDMKVFILSTKLLHKYISE